MNDLTEYKSYWLILMTSKKKLLSLRNERYFRESIYLLFFPDNPSIINEDIMTHPGRTTLIDSIHLPQQFK